MVGREKEVQELNELYNSKEAEFVAVYGRCRVGKTYLVDETFAGRFTFRHAGLSPYEKGIGSPFKAQLQAFYYSLLHHGLKKSRCPKDWLEAFFLLEKLLIELDDGSRQLVFIDELPWMDTARSGFVTAFENFWNGWASHRKNIMLIVCGSANSWILNRLINNQGGLYNRITYEIKLEPFTLKECEELYKERNIEFSHYDMVASYMIFGGIPFYLNYLQKGKSLSQNIDDLFFTKNAKLTQEYERLFASVFNNPSDVKTIVELLAQKGIGYTRKEVSELTKISNGGGLSELLNSLIASDFVVKYVPFGLSKKSEYYKLVDPFCLFYLKFVKGKNELNEAFWMENVSSQVIQVWRGFAFENVCFNHIKQIKAALGISGVVSKQSAWSKHEKDEKGTQIDLVIERKDNVVNMCEIKFYSEYFVVDKEYDELLRHRRNLLANELNKKQVIHNTLITTFGLKNNQYSNDFVKVITMDDLFS